LNTVTTSKHRHVKLRDKLALNYITIS